MTSDPPLSQTTLSATPEQLRAAGYHSAAEALSAGRIVSAYILPNGTVGIVYHPALAGPIVVGGKYA